MFCAFCNHKWNLSCWQPFLVGAAERGKERVLPSNVPTVGSQLAWPFTRVWCYHLTEPSFQINWLRRRREENVFCYKVFTCIVTGSTREEHTTLCHGSYRLVRKGEGWWSGTGTRKLTRSKYETRVGDSVSDLSECFPVSKRLVAGDLLLNWVTRYM